MSTFRSPRFSSSCDDVTAFLSTNAIVYEKEDTTRTYILINDEEWARGNLRIDGYFSIALKVLCFSKEVDDAVISEMFGGGRASNRVAFLIGQLARSLDAPKGTGEFLLNEAQHYIAGVSDVIGGRIIYLDCEESLVPYYESNGFEFLQHKHKSPLIQMYKIL